jgi:ATP-dependent Lhr-like helicase
MIARTKLKVGRVSVEGWFAGRDWTPSDYQRQTWQAYLAGQSGIVQAPTGTGKSYSIWMALVQEGLDEHPDPAAWPEKPEPLRVLWITPMRALASDLVVSLRAPVVEMGLPWSVEMRTGDTSSAERRRQRDRLPTALVTTPESLSLLLSYADAAERLHGVRCVIVDEWHELLGTKRGVQTELGLARLRTWNPQLRTWGLSATLGNVAQSAEVLMGNAARSTSTGSVIINGTSNKQIDIRTILPHDIERFPWAGHLGVRLLPQVLEALEQAGTSLLFTNTRSQAEIWFRAILAARPKWAAELAVHHGSIDRDIRAYVERRLREGTIRCVVCTSSLDLGVDFSPVDQVVQVGSPKGIARLLQRAGRSGHQPGAVSRLLCVPTNAFELVEYAGARAAALGQQMEDRVPVELPMDLLAQHMVTIALGGGFVEQELLREVRTTYAFRNLTDEQWLWALDFVVRGGHSLRAYPQYSRLMPFAGRFEPTSNQVARLHRMSIGTITSDASFLVKFVTGKSLGTIEESFIARLRPGDCFAFAGKTLEFVRSRDLTAYVRKSKKTSGVVPRWDGGRFPLSSKMADAVRAKFAEARDGIFDDPEMQSVRPVLELQRAWSHLPGPNQLLIEESKVREGHQLFVYPFAGRSVNEGMGMLLAYRIARDTPASITVTVNDYGMELLSTGPLLFSEPQWRRLLSTDELLDDLLACLNTSELARRQFRDIARVSGLVFSGYPGAPRSARQLQASSGLLYDVFREYDPENLLLAQARREVLTQQLESSRLHAALEAIGSMELLIKPTPRLTPLAFPLWAMRIQTSHLSTERWTTRIERMIRQLEKAAGVEGTEDRDQGTGKKKQKNRDKRFAE